MSIALFAACLWVLAATAVAFLPMRYQVVPGLILLAAAPLLIGFIFVQNGAVGAGLATLAVLSMYRQPLRHYAARAVSALK